MNCDNNQNNNGCGCNCNPNPTSASTPADINMSVCDRNINMLPMLQTYTTKVLKPNIEGCCKKNILTQQMMNCEGYKYVIKWNFDLDGKTITVPNNCILEFDGGSLKNGTIIGQITLYINVGDTEIWGENLTREGTWREKKGGGIPDKEYDPEAHSGLGRKTLQLKGDSNILTQEDFPTANTIYVITYDFELGEDIMIPENSVLEFAGGSIKDGGENKNTLTGNNTGIVASIVNILSKDVVLDGSWSNMEVYPEWFGAKGDYHIEEVEGVETEVGADDSDAMQAAANTRKTIKLNKNHTYLITRRINMYGSIDGNNATIKCVYPNVSSAYIPYRALEYDRIENFEISNLTLESNGMGIGFRACRNFSIHNINTYIVKFALYLGGVKIDDENTAWCENFHIYNIHFNADPNWANSDGVHLDRACRNGVIESLTGYTTDDVVALNAPEIYDDDVTNEPKEEDRIITDIIVNSVNTDKATKYCIRIYGWAGYEVHNVTFNNCNFYSTPRTDDPAPCVRIIPTGSFGESSEKMITVRGIVFNNCTFDNSAGTNSFVFGAIGVKGDVVFNDCYFALNKLESIVLHRNDSKITLNRCTIVSIQLWYMGIIQPNKIELILDKCRFPYRNANVKSAGFYRGLIDCFADYGSTVKLKAFIKDCVQFGAEDTPEDFDFPNTQIIDNEIETEGLDSYPQMDIEIENLKNPMISFKKGNINLKARNCDDIKVRIANEATGVIDLVNCLCTATDNILLPDSTYASAGTPNLRYKGDSVQAYIRPMYPQKGDSFKSNYHGIIVPGVSPEPDTVYPLFVKFDGSSWVPQHTLIITDDMLAYFTHKLNGTVVYNAASKKSYIVENGKLNRLISDGSIELRENTDFNNITEAGFYGINTWLTGISNAPIDKLFGIMVVETMYWDNLKHIKQTITANYHNEAIVTYYRLYNPATPAWSNWYLVTTEEITNV